MDFDTLWQHVSLSRIKLTFLQAKLSFWFLSVLEVCALCIHMLCEYF